MTDKITKIMLTGGPCAGKTTAMARIIERGDCNTREAAEKRSDKINKLRAEYYNFYTDKLWGHAESYDLSIDSSLLGIEDTAQFIVEFVKRRLE